MAKTYKNYKNYGKMGDVRWCNKKYQYREHHSMEEVISFIDTLHQCTKRCPDCMVAKSIKVYTQQHSPSIENKVMRDTFTVAGLLNHQRNVIGFQDIEADDYGFLDDEKRIPFGAVTMFFEEKKDKIKLQEATKKVEEIVQSMSWLYTEYQHVSIILHEGTIEANKEETLYWASVHFHG